MIQSSSTRSLLTRFQSSPPGKLFCLTGNDKRIFSLSLSMASHVLLQGIPVAVVDGSNRFDAHMIAETARRVTSGGLIRGRVTPEELLGRIFVARAFTCYQMEATITERLPAFLRKIDGSVAIVFGLLDTFYDEQAPLFEVQMSVGRIITGLQKIKEENVSVLLTSRELKLESKERNALLPRVKAAMDHVYRMEEVKQMLGS